MFSGLKIYSPIFNGWTSGTDDSLLNVHGCCYSRYSKSETISRSLPRECSEGYTRIRRLPCIYANIRSTGGFNYVYRLLLARSRVSPGSPFKRKLFAYSKLLFLDGGNILPVHLAPGCPVTCWESRGRLYTRQRKDSDDPSGVWAAKDPNDASQASLPRSLFYRTTGDGLN